MQDVLADKRKPGMTRAGSTAGGGVLEADTQYEHSEARQDNIDGLDEDGGGLAHHVYEPPAGSDEGDDGVQHFSQPTPSSPAHRSHTHAQQPRTGRLHSDDEGETPVRAMMQAPPNRNRNLAERTSGGNLATRFGSDATATNQSAQFGVADSRDWKSDAGDDLLEDDIEELRA